LEMSGSARDLMTVRTAGGIERDAIRRRQESNHLVHLGWVQNHIRGGLSARCGIISNFMA
jgi:hypothetical protein